MLVIESAFEPGTAPLFFSPPLGCPTSPPLKTEGIEDVFTIDAEEKPPALGQVDYWDTKVTGLGLRVSQGGKKTWNVWYRNDAHPKGCRLTLKGGRKLAALDCFTPLTLADKQIHIAAKIAWVID